MSSCDKFKFKKGELLNTNGDGEILKWNSILSTWEKKHVYTYDIYKLIIIDENGNEIAKVNEDNIVYMHGDGRNYIVFLNDDYMYDGWTVPFDQRISIKFENRSFIIAREYGDPSGTLKFIDRDMMEVTEYGEKVLSECSGHIMEYDAPTSNNYDHLNHPINDDHNTNEVQYSPMDSTVFQLY